MHLIWKIIISKIYVTVKGKENSLQMTSEPLLDLKLSVRGTGD